MVRDFGKTAEAGPGTSGDLPGGDLVLFTSRDGAVSVTAALRGETVWLTQEQMAQVFQVQRPAITKHLRNIYRTGELAEESTCSMMEHLGQEGMVDSIVKATGAERFVMVRPPWSLGWRSVSP